MVWKRKLNNDMKYTINTTVRNIAENGTEQERTLYQVIGTDREGNASIVGNYDTEEGAQEVVRELEALDED
jgi:hypothetical protein